MALTIQNTKPKQVGFFVGVVTAIFAIALQPILASGLVGAIVINELMPNPTTISDAKGEWVELRNNGASDQDLSGWTIDDVTMPASTQIPAGELLVICRSAEATQECDIVDGALELTNTGETLELRDENAQLVDSFEYTGSSDGKSIEVLRENNTVTAVDNDTDTYPTAESTPNTTDNTGTPGTANRAQPAPTAVTNTSTGTIYNDLQSAVDAAGAGDTLVINEDLTTTQQVTVNKQVAIDGGGNTLTADFIKTDPSNNAAIGVYADGVSITNILLDGVNPVINKLHGINLYEVSGIAISSVTINNFQAGVQVNGSVAEVISLTTSGNSWAAVEVGQGVNVSTPAVLTITGPVSHAETSSFGYPGFIANIWVKDNTQDVTVNDPNGLYSKNTYLNSDYYVLDLGPDPTDSHQLTLSGTIYRDRAVDDCDTRSECLAQPANNELEGWEVRLYKENESGDWVYVKSATSNEEGVYKLGAQKQPGTYHVCEVLPAGWSQVKQTWSGSGYKVDTSNQSGATDEGPYCTTTNYGDTKDRSSKSRIGNVDSKKPFTQILSPVPDGQAYSTDFTVIAKTTDSESGIVQAVMNLYDDGGFKASCTNDAISPAESMHQYSCDVDVDGLAEGDYYLKVNSKDAQDNTSNTEQWIFSVDKTAPDAPSIIKPGARQWFRSAPIVNEWTSVADPSGIDYYQIAYNYDDGHSFGGSTCPGVNMVGYVGFIGCRDVDSTKRNHQPGTSEEGGVTIWVRAVDNAGNIGPWSAPVNYHYDRTNPITTIVAPSGISDGTFSVSGEAGDNLNLNRVYVQLVNRDDGKRYGGTTIHLISQGTSADWQRDYDTQSDDLPDGTYAAHVSVVDMAGNTSSAGWTDNFMVDGTKPSAKVVTPANGELRGSDFTVSGTASDNQTSVDYVKYTVTEIDAIGGNYVVNVTSGTATGTDNWTFDLSGLATGFYRLKVQAFDAAGNWRYHYNDVEVDADAPDVVLATPVNGTYSYENDGAIEVRGSIVDDNLSHYWLKIKGPNGYNQGPGQVTSDEFGEKLLYSWNLQGLEDGDYEITFSARDKADNKDGGSKVVRTVTVDNTAPAVVIVAPAKDAIFTTGPVTVSGTIDDLDVDTVSVTLNGTTQDADVQPDGSWETTFAAVPVGTYEVVAVATDAVGNSEPVTVENVTVNPVPPAILTPLPAITPNGGEDDGDNTEVLGVSTPTTATAALQNQPLTTVGVSQLQNGAGVQTSESNTAADVESVEVAGVTDPNAEVAPVDALDEVEDEGCWSLLGLCWYWWVAIGVGGGIVVYAIVATRRSDEA